MNEIIISQSYFIAVGSLMLFCLLCSVAALHTAVQVTIHVKAKEQSTHSIEFRNPNVAYDDELDLDKLTKSKSVIQPVSREDDIDGMNTFIKENDIIL